MTETHHYTYENASQPFIEDLVDDAIEVIPTTGLGVPQGLKPRFLRRMSKLLAASMTIKEDSSRRSVDIFLSRDRNSVQPRLEMDEYLRKFVRDLEPILGSVASRPKGAQRDRAVEEMWDVILVVSYNDTDKVIQSLKRSFDDNGKLFDDFVSKMFGIEDRDQDNWERDEELGDRIIQIFQAVKAYEKSMKEINSLIHAASEMTRVLMDLNMRLNSLLGKAQFASELFELICELGFPERAYSTMVRAARTSQSFANVTFHLRSPSPAKRVSFTTSATSGSVISSRVSPQHPPHLDVFNTSNSNSTFSTALSSFNEPQYPPLSTHPQQPESASLGPLMTAVQAFLPKEDRGQALFRLTPSAKQETTQLIGTISRGRLLQVESNAWYSFGFVVAKDEAEERQLAGLYAALIEESIDPERIFREIQEAVENQKLVALFDIKEYGHFRDLLPHLERFLSAKPDERPTVWRLKQFIQSTDDDEPPACLKRDYGFRFCKGREHVLISKSIYDKILHKMGSRKLHSACIQGRLLQTAMNEGVVIDVKHRRLIQNDFPVPVGFDDDFRLDSYRETLFKSSKKMKL